MRTARSVALVVGLTVAASGGATEKAPMPAAASAAKPAKEPFYRRFLTPGNHLDDQIREQEKMVDASPGSASLHNDLGNLLALRRFPKEAREQYGIAMKIDKKWYLPYYNIGIVYETEGQITRAIWAYEKCVDRNRGFPPGLFRLGRLYEGRGRDREAIAAYAKALRIDPGMRDPARNPLVVDVRLLDRASLTDYQQDLASASLAVDSRYVDEGRFHPLPYDRSLGSREAEEPAPDASAPTAGSAQPAPRAPASLPAAPGQTRPQALAPGPAPAPTPATPGRPATQAVPRGIPVYAPPPAPQPLITPIPPPPTPEA